MAIKIIIVDDHQILLDTTEMALANHPEITLSGMVNNGKQLLELLEQDIEHPDVLILDIEMPEMDGLETLRQVKEKYPSIKTLMLSMKNSAAIVEMAQELGVHGYVLKNSGIKKLLLAIQCVAGGNLFFDADLPPKSDTPSSYNFNTLTKREREVLQLSATGKTMREISESLHIGFHAVQKHRSNMMSKLEAHNIILAIIKGKELGIL